MDGVSEVDASAVTDGPNTIGGSETFGGLNTPLDLRGTRDLMPASAFVASVLRWTLA